MNLKEEVTMNTVQITDNSMEKVVKENKIVLVDFWAPWCGPCRIIGPILEQLAAEVDKDTVIAKLNVDENRLMAAKYQIQGIPTMKLFVNGLNVETFVGVRKLEELKSAILKYA